MDDKTRKHVWPRLLPTLAALALVAIAASAHAQTPGAETSRGWQFQVSPYAWIASLKGDVGTRPNLPTASVDVSFSDILKHTDIALMVAGEARHGDWGLMLDVLYLSVSDGAATPGQLFGSADVDAKTYYLAPAAVYRAYDTKPVAVDVGAGARYWHLKTELDLSAGLLPAVSSSESKSWVDPLLILRGTLDLGSGFSLLGYGDIGGFDVGSRLTWSLLGLVQYSFNDWIEGAIGYRHLDVDYRNDGFVWDVRLSGPILGVRFRF